MTQETKLYMSLGLINVLYVHHTLMTGLILRGGSSKVLASHETDNIILPHS
jgi:hypothetical protein